MCYDFNLFTTSDAYSVLAHGYRCTVLTSFLLCSENEAVVAELLRSSNGTLELVDARANFLPKFKARPGLSHWYSKSLFDEG
jgi:hypothetical protein